MSFLRTLRKLIMGETWALPLGVAAAVGVAAVLRVVAGAGGWWGDAGGFVICAMLAVALFAALPRGRS